MTATWKCRNMNQRKSLHVSAKRQPQRMTSCFFRRNTTFTNTNATRSTPPTAIMRLEMMLILIALLSSLGPTLAVDNEEQYGTGLSLSSGYG
jgi:hypothetical protein